MSGLTNVSFASQGWECPKCGRVYSPTTPMCYYCGGGSKTTSTTPNTTPDIVTLPYTPNKYPFGYTEITCDTCDKCSGSCGSCNTHSSAIKTSQIKDKIVGSSTVTPTRHTTTTVGNPNSVGVKVAPTTRVDVKGIESELSALLEEIFGGKSKGTSPF